MCRKNTADTQVVVQCLPVTQGNTEDYTQAVYKTI